MSGGAPPPDVALAAEDLVLAYGSTLAIGASTFTIPAGAVTAIIGPNGSGKSTLLNAIAGLMEPASGTITVPAAAAGPQRIAYVLQTTKVNDTLPITVYETVMMGRYARTGPFGRLTPEDRRAVAEALERMGISGLANRHLQELSGGQRQRVFVAQGLAQDHDLLLLDEPLTGIDLPAAQAIDSIIHDERSRGSTVVMTTHDLPEARAADHVLLVSGRVVASGPPGEVLTARYLAEAYGPSLLHAGDEEVVFEDPAHQPVGGWHSHRARTIHTESAPTDLHGD